MRGRTHSSRSPHADSPTLECEMKTEADPVWQAMNAVAHCGVRRGPDAASTIEPRSSLGELCFYISRAFYAYSGLLQGLLEDHGLNKHLSVGDGHVIFALFEKDDVIIKDLVTHTQLSPSTLTRIVRRLESAGVIESRRCRDDGRATRIRLTPLGRSLERNSYRTLRDVHNVLETGMTRGQRETLREGFAKMLDNMRNHAGG